MKEKQNGTAQSTSYCGKIFCAEPSALSGSNSRAGMETSAISFASAAVRTPIGVTGCRNKPAWD